MVKPCQSSEEPLRTKRALVKAANIIVMANITTQMAVEDGGGEYSSVMRGSPSDGTRFLQPPLPECPSSDGWASICGGSGTVVAINCLSSGLKPRPSNSYFSSRSVLTCSGEVCIT